VSFTPPVVVHFLFFKFKGFLLCSYLRWDLADPKGTTGSVWPDILKTENCSQIHPSIFWRERKLLFWTKDSRNVAVCQLMETHLHSTNGKQRNNSTSFKNHLLSAGKYQWTSRNGRLLCFLISTPNILALNRSLTKPPPRAVSVS